MLILQNLSYKHPNKDLLFEHLNLTLSKNEKLALIGNNGSGKSTLLRLIARELLPSEGEVITFSKPYYVPQLFGQYNEFTIAQALRIEEKLNALQAIIKGHVTEANMALLDDDWTIEERCAEAMSYWGLQHLDLSMPLAQLSGGQKTKLFLAGITIHQPSLVLLDEPSNHLDGAGRELLYHFLQNSRTSFVVVSHDRQLLNFLDLVYELSGKTGKVYGGNYSFYQEQKRIETAAFHEEVKNKEKALRKAKQVERETIERQQKLDARGKKKQEKAGLPTILMNTLRNNAEKSTSKIKAVHAEKTDGLAQDLKELRSELPSLEQMKFSFDQSVLHKGKLLFSAADVNYSYGKQMLWKEPLAFQLQSGERLAIKGQNGSGKTTLIRLVLGEMEPLAGEVKRAEYKAVYVDQEYSIIDNRLTVYEQAQVYNTTALQEHEIKIRLTRFLFTKDDWYKRCGVLSGGEKMRLILCCLTIASKAPDMIVLDEPTNNLDIQNIEILTNAINQYEGTVVVVSHDIHFLNEIEIKRAIELK